MAAASIDSTVRVWKAETNVQQETFEIHIISVFSVAFSPSGQWLAFVLANWTMRIKTAFYRGHLKAYR